jgi:hypothetical protein
MTRQLALVLRSHGLRLIRPKRHMVWRHPSGHNFITAKTPSDRFAENNVRAELRRFRRVNVCGGAS